MRLFVIFSLILVMAWANPLLKRKLLYNNVKERSMFGANTGCTPPTSCGSFGNAYNSQGYSSGGMTHLAVIHSDTRPAPVLNYANNQVSNAAAASLANSGVATYGAVPAVPAGPTCCGQGNQYNAYSPSGYTGYTSGGSTAAAAAAAASSSSALNQQSGNYFLNNGGGAAAAAAAHAGSTSWSSSNLG